MATGHYFAVYILASVALVGIAIHCDLPQLKASSKSQKAILFKKNAETQRLGEIIKFGLFAFDATHARKVALDSEQNVDDTNSFEYNEATPDFPDWLPEILQNGWAFVAIAVLTSSTLTLLFLRSEVIHKKTQGWIGWFEKEGHILRGLTCPQIPIHVMTGIFSVAGPIFFVRVLGLDVALLGVLVLVEHAVQVLTQYLCGSYVDSAGNKAGQQRAVQLLFAMSLFLAWLPFVPESFITEHPWLTFSFYAVARMLFAWGTNQFDANYNSAINNAAFLPPEDIIKTLDIFFAFSMLGNFVGALIALSVEQFADTRWSFAFPLLLTGAMFIIVETIPQDETMITFPPDPADISAESKRKRKWQEREAKDRFSLTSRSGSMRDLKVDGENRLPWMYNIWFEEEPRWLLIQFIVILLLFSSLATAFTFMLPLAAMNLGLTSQDVAFLVAMPSIVGLNLFWLGSAFDHTGYVTKACLTGAGFAAAYLTAFASTMFTGLFSAAFIFALTVCYSCDLVLLLRICFLHRVTRFGRKSQFANAQEYASHLVAFNAPLIALVIDLASIQAAFAVWGVLAAFAVVWVGVVARKSIQEATKLDHVTHGGTELEEAADRIFDEIDTNHDQVLSKEELLAYMAKRDVKGEVRGVMLDGILRLADRDGSGNLSRPEWRKSYAAVMELASIEEQAEGERLFPAQGGGPGSA